MNDSLSLAIALALTFAPAKPNLDREVRIVAPTGQTIAMARPSARPSENLTTCFENRAGSCWSEN